MIEYLEQKDGSLSGKKGIIPAAHPWFSQALAEIAEGRATIEYYSGSNRQLEDSQRDAIYHFLSARGASVAAITVIVDGMEFDGDEVSQGRMARAVSAAINLTDVTQWKLTDNTVADVTGEQLKRALRLAGIEQTLIWMA